MGKWTFSPSSRSTSGPDTPSSRAERRHRTSRLLARASRATGARRERIIAEVILLNASVARSIAHRYAGRGISHADLEQVAYVALVRAAVKWKRLNPKSIPRGIMFQIKEISTDRHGVETF